MRFAVLALALMSAAGPAFAGPGGCHSGEETAQISCAEGQVWDAKSASCIPLQS